jgi:hypothetical protein
MNSGFGELGVVLEAMNTIKEDVRELKTAILDPENGMSRRLALTEHRLRDLEERTNKDAALIAELRFTQAIVKWAAAALGGSALLGFGALLVKAVLWP